MIQLLVDKKIDIEEKSEEDEEKTDSKTKFKTCFSLLKLVSTRLQQVLKLLVKCCLTKPPPNKDCEKLAELYKKCYKRSFDLKEGLNCEELLIKLRTVLAAIRSECEILNDL